jgi:hypothetical protein
MMGTGGRADTLEILLSAPPASQDEVHAMQCAVGARGSPGSLNRFIVQTNRIEAAALHAARRR